MTLVPMEDSDQLRQTMIAAARLLAVSGLTRNTSGNLGQRVAGGLLVTPTGMPYTELEPEDLVFISWDGAAKGRRLPTSEWRFHRDILRDRPEISTVLHAHSPFATTLACLRRAIPAFHYMVAKAGGKDIRCAPYATFGSEVLSRHAVTALEGRRACLLANHGMIVLGRDFTQAQSLAVEVETLAELYWRALQVGAPVILDDDEMALMVEKFRTYGEQPSLPASEHPFSSAKD